MLKGIPSALSPELLKVLAEMGHGDTIVIGDANFAAASLAKAKRNVNIRCDGQRATTVMNNILQLMPLDDFIIKPVLIMNKAEEHKELECPVWDEFVKIVEKYDARGAAAIDFVDRFDFYDLAKEAYAIVSTTETAYYACVILQKGTL
ncbi:MAG: fucose isomerase [Fastidiosipila sp.]|nr:fucose isomerase [Fastidiosipila sp.]